MGILINGDDGNTDGDAVFVILLKIIKCLKNRNRLPSQCNKFERSKKNTEFDSDICRMF